MEQRSRLGRVSAALNRLLGGREGWSLCAHWAETRGPDCLPCRIVAWALREPGHCAEELQWTRDNVGGHVDPRRLG